MNHLKSSSVIYSNAELSLREVLERTLIYTSPGGFVHCVDRYWIECFNSMLQYHDKRLTRQSLWREILQLSFEQTCTSLTDWKDHVNNRRCDFNEASLKLIREIHAVSLIRRLEDKMVLGAQCGRGTPQFISDEVRGRTFPARVCSRSINTCSARITPPLLPKSFEIEASTHARIFIAKGRFNANF